MAATSRRIVSCITALTFALQPALALAGQGVLPTGGTVVQGTAAIVPTAGGLGITQGSSKAILNWQSFSIGAGQKVTINNGSGATLNRVTGADASTLAGKLQSTGSVYLINPAGIVIGPNGKVVTGGSFVASTRDLADADFMAGKTQNFGGTSDGAVVNNGSIISKDGSVALIGSSVTNNGTVAASEGVVAFAAGDQVILDPAAKDGRILVATSGGKDVTNTGAISAAAVQLTAAQGNVYALAGNAGTIHATGTKTMDGHVWLTGGDTTEIAGDVTAVNADGSGGAIVATGSTVQVDKGAMVRADGTTGGTILIGGDRGGSADVAQKLVSSDIANASTTTVAKGAVLSAKGSSGNGGSVIVWSDDHTSFAGSILAGSDNASSAGGFAEISSHGVLSFTGTANTTGLAKQAGTVLLDPTDLSIVTVPAGSASDSSVIDPATLEGLLANGNVTLATNSNGTQPGNVTFYDSVDWSSGSSLTVNAIHDIDINQGVALTNEGSGGLFLRADALGSGSGTVNIAGSVASAGGTAILYNPASIGTATDYSANVSGPFVAYQLVNTVGDLQAMGSAGTGTYALGRDIDGSAGFTPIVSFDGILNGFEHTLANFTINGGTGIVGFFGTLSRDALIENINFSNVTVTAAGQGYGSGVPTAGVGLVAGYNQGTIANVTTSGSVTSSGEDSRGFGGIAGYNGGTIENSISAAVVSGPTGYLAGVAGGNFGTISLTGSTGNVTDTVDNDTLGGLVASNFGTISQSYATGNVTGQSGVDIGGLVAVNYGTVEQSFATGNVSAGTSLGSGGSFYGSVVGGLIGWNYSGPTTDSYATGNVTGGSALNGQNVQVGGAIGQNLNTAQNIFATGSVSGGSGAVVGPVIGADYGQSSNIYTSRGGSVGSYPGFSTSVWTDGSAHPLLLWQAVAGIGTGGVSGGGTVNTGGCAGTGGCGAPPSTGGFVGTSTGTNSSGTITTPAAASSSVQTASSQSAGLGALSAGELAATIGETSPQLASTTFPSALLDQYAISPNEVYNPMATVASDFALDMMVAQNGLAPGSLVFYTGVSSAGVAGPSSAGVAGISSAGVQGPSSAGVTGYSLAGASLANLPDQGGLTQGGVAPGSIVFAGNMTTYGPLVGSGSPVNGVMTGGYGGDVESGNGETTLDYNTGTSLLDPAQLAALEQDNGGMMSLTEDDSDAAATAAGDTAGAAAGTDVSDQTGATTSQLAQQALLQQQQAQYEQTSQQTTDPGLSKTGQQKWMLNNLITMTNICIEQHTGGKAGEAYESRRNNRLIYSALKGLRDGTSTGVTQTNYSIVSVPPSVKNLTSPSPYGLGGTDLAQPSGQGEE